MHLNEQVIKKIEPPSDRHYVLVRDDEVTGLAVRVTSNNARSFTLDYTIDGRQRRMTIGAWPVWSTAAARERAKELRRQIDRGDDPLAEKEARREALTFRAVAEEYLARHAAGKRSGYRDREYLERDVFSVWGARKAQDIRRRDVIATGRGKGRQDADRREPPAGGRPQAFQLGHRE